MSCDESVGLKVEMLGSQGRTAGAGGLGLHNQFTWNFECILVFELNAERANIRHFEQMPAAFPKLGTAPLSPRLDDLSGSFLFKKAQFDAGIAPRELDGRWRSGG